MFGLSSFSQAPFSSLVITSDDGWSEVRGDGNVWIDQAPPAEGPLPSLSLNFLTGTYEVVLTLVDYDQIWQQSSSNSNSWVEV